MLLIPHEVIHRLFFGGFSSDVCEKESGQGSLTIRDQQQNPSGPLIEFDADHSRHSNPKKHKRMNFQKTGGKLLFFSHFIHSNKPTSNIHI